MKAQNLEAQITMYNWCVIHYYGDMDSEMANTGSSYSNVLGGRSGLQAHTKLFQEGITIIWCSTKLCMEAEITIQKWYDNQSKYIGYQDNSNLLFILM